MHKKSDSLQFIKKINSRELACSMKHLKGR